MQWLISPLHKCNPFCWHCWNPLSPNSHRFLTNKYIKITPVSSGQSHVLAIVSFAAAGPRPWNSLPIHLRQPDLRQFLRVLKKKDASVSSCMTAAPCDYSFFRRRIEISLLLIYLLRLFSNFFKQCDSLYTTFLQVAIVAVRRIENTVLFKIPQNAF